MSLFILGLAKTNENTLFGVKKLRFLFDFQSYAARGIFPSEVSLKGHRSCLICGYSTILKPQPNVFVKKKKIPKKRPYQELIGVLETHHRVLKSKPRTLVQVDKNYEGSYTESRKSFGTNETAPTRYSSDLLVKELPCDEQFAFTEDLKIQDYNSSDKFFPASRFHDLESSEIVDSEFLFEDAPGDQRGNLISPSAKSSGKQIKQKVKSAELIKEEFEMKRKFKESNLNFQLLSYIDVCIQAGLLNKAFDCLKFYVQCGKRNSNSAKVNSVAVYNLLLHGFAGKGDLQQLTGVFDLMNIAKVKPNLQSYAAHLECLARQKVVDKTKCRSVLQLINSQNLNLENIYHCKFLGDQQDKVFQAIKIVKPDFEPNSLEFPKDYECNLLQPLNEESNRKFYSPLNGVVDVEELSHAFQKQMALEINGNVSIKSVFKTSASAGVVKTVREKLFACEREWRKIVSRTFRHNIVNLKNQKNVQNGMQLYPYLIILEPSYYVDVIMQEVRNLATASESYSPLMDMLYRNLGSKAMMKYVISMKEKHGFSEKVAKIHREYMKHCINHKNVEKNPREIWQHFVTSHMEGPSFDYRFVHWPHEVQIGVGHFLFNIILHSIRLDLNVFRKKCKSEKLIPAFYSVFRHYNYHMKEEIKPHPLLSKLYREAALDDINFEATALPMLTPPVPWISHEVGGFLLSDSPFVRLPPFARQQRLILAKAPVQQLYPSFDSLNALAACPWIVNKPVLDVMIEVFNNNGSNELDIPQPPASLPLPVVLPTMTYAEKAKVFKDREVVKRKRAEMFSLWCDTLYKLSIANHFRDSVFWFPHNMDFRGRVYPTPPHFNHLGSDPIRSLMLFAKGEPLGARGLDWLKIHLINLTAFKKRASVEERLKYADEVLPEILDSADFPLTGRKWWQTSDHPWQTLACCMELANAIRSPDPEKYVCHFHVHQDGSCNGLQHYAALGRDEQGACEVNLHPSDLPQDVYSGVAALVERQRAKDAALGSKIAQVLEGCVKRKVIKQTVMTVVYGVTRYGARYQILRQLKDLDDFPEEFEWKAAGYLTQQTFNSILELFTAAKEIQNWFNDCASYISKSLGKPVEWVTPLGFPVIQPYHKTTITRMTLQSGKQVSCASKFNMFERPNSIKQKNAFPPNFIHSLDSSHMMLTAIYCQRERITFMSVHDCYWTHPNHVDVMNKVCREQFVALHSEPILENLSKFFVQKYSKTDNSCPEKSKSDMLLNNVLKQIPKKGYFDLKNVLKSTYFFS